MKIFLSYSHKDTDLVAKIRDGLLARGHNVFFANDAISGGESIPTETRIEIIESDIFVPILTEKSIHSKWMTFDIGTFIGYITSSASAKLILPIVIGHIEVPDVYSQFIYYRVELDLDIAEVVVDTISNAVARLAGQKIANEEKANIIQEKIERSAADYVQDTISTLEKKEKSFKFFANLWYFIGFITLLGGVTIAGYVAIHNTNKGSDWVDTLYLSVKAALVIILLLSTSKYSFNLGKASMNESLKNSDRIHAISFGKFYLNVFQSEIKKEDIKEIFRDWNLENNSKFNELKSDDYDPKLVEIITKVVESIKK